MPLPLIAGALGGLALGGVKSLLGAGQEKRDRALAADTQRYSPWTGMQAAPVKENDVVGNLVSGGVAGAQFGQGLDSFLGQQNAAQAQQDETANFMQQFGQRQAAGPKLGNYKL